MHNTNIWYSPLWLVWDTMGRCKFASYGQMERDGWLKRPAIAGQRGRIPLVGRLCTRLAMAAIIGSWCRCDWRRCPGGRERTRGTGKGWFLGQCGRSPLPMTSHSRRVNSVWVSARCLYPATSSIVQPDACGLLLLFRSSLMLVHHGNCMVWLGFFK
jgi:hypothetical protein